MPKPVFEMKVDGIDQLLKTFKGYFDDIENDIDILTSMAIIGKDVQKKAQEILGDKIYNKPNSPFYTRTGLLKARTVSDAPKVVKGEPTVTIRNIMKYSVYIEMGTGIHAEGGKGRKTPWKYPIIKNGEIVGFLTTSGMKPQPFLRPAALAENDNSLKTLTNGLIKFLKKKVVK